MRLCTRDSAGPPSHHVRHDRWSGPRARWFPKPAPRLHRRYPKADLPRGGTGVPWLNYAPRRTGSQASLEALLFPEYVLKKIIQEIPFNTCLTRPRRGGSSQRTQMATDHHQGATGERHLPPEQRGKASSFPRGRDCNKGPPSPPVIHAALNRLRATQAKCPLSNRVFKDHSDWHVGNAQTAGTGVPSTSVSRQVQRTTATGASPTELVSPSNQQ